MTAPVNFYVAYSALPYSFHEDHHLNVHFSRFPPAAQSAVKWMYYGHETTIAGVLERAQTSGARAEPITLEEAYARQAKRVKGEKNGLLVTVRAPDLPPHLRKSAVAWKPGAPNDDTIPLGQFEGDYLTFDFMPGWSLLRSAMGKKAPVPRSSEEPISIYFAIWDIGEFTESRSKRSARNLLGYGGDYDLEYDVRAGGGREGEGSAKTKKKNAARRRAKNAKKAAQAAGAEAGASKEGQQQQEGSDKESSEDA